MATTSPDSIRTPDAGDQYALVQDLGALADSVQSALNRRANSFTGTSAQRQAYTSAPEGALWTDSTAPYRTYRRRGGGWVVYKPRAAGEIGPVTITASTPVDITVPLPSGLFSTAPTILLSLNTPTAFDPQPTLRVYSRSSTSFRAQFRSTIARTDVRADWIAVPSGES